MIIVIVVKESGPEMTDHGYLEDLQRNAYGINYGIVKL